MCASPGALAATPLLHHHLLRHPSPRRAAAITSTIVAAPPLAVGLLHHVLFSLSSCLAWRSPARGDYTINATTTVVVPRSI